MAISVSFIENYVFQNQDSLASCPLEGIMLWSHPEGVPRPSGGLRTSLSVSVKIRNDVLRP